MSASILKTTIRDAMPRSMLTAVKRLIHAGSARTCPVCQSSVRSFLPQGYGYPLLEELEVVGGMRREDDECPICHAHDRVRLIDLYCSHHSDLLQRPNRLLHLAPELGLAEKWVHHSGLDYVPADLDTKRYKHLPTLKACDLQDMPFDDASFDWVICNHVLEHIPDDRRAMREILRVLKPGGIALLQVPLALQRSATDEDPSLSDPVARIQRFGQSDHIRLYGRDYYERLADEGFEVEIWCAFEADPKRAKALSLNPKERLTVARRPKAAR